MENRKKTETLPKVRIAPEVRARLLDLARAHDRSEAYMIRRAVYELIKKPPGDPPT